MRYIDSSGVNQPCGSLSLLAGVESPEASLSFIHELTVVDVIVMLILFVTFRRQFMIQSGSENVFWQSEKLVSYLTNYSHHT